jgi:hypothetical protein
MMTRSAANELVEGPWNGQHTTPLGSYHVEILAELLTEESNLIEWLIDFAFGALDARHLDVRVLQGEL